MMYKVSAAFIMCISVTLALASNQAFGQSGAALGGRAASTHSTSHPSITRSLHHQNRSAMLHHRNRRNIQPFFNGGFCCETLNGVPNTEVAQPPGSMSGDFHYTFKNEVPWDWAHSLPPNFFGAAPADSPAPAVSYAPGCRTQTVTAPGTDGKDQTINMVRC